MTRSSPQPLYLPPVDHRASLQMGMFGWKGAPALAQLAGVRRVVAP